jgi:hypothetical protein
VLKNGSTSAAALFGAISRRDSSRPGISRASTSPRPEQRMLLERTDPKFVPGRNSPPCYVRIHQCHGAGLTIPPIDTCRRSRCARSYHGGTTAMVLTDDSRSARDCSRRD